MSASISPLGKTILSNVTLFENNGRFVLCATDDHGERYRVLSIEFAESKAPVVIELPDTFDSRSLRRWLAEQSGSESFQIRIRGVAFLGFVCLLDDDWHMHFATGKSVAGVVGGHTIYRVSDASLQPLKPEPDSGSLPLTQKYRALFNSIDMSKDFFFSYSFDLTKSMQNIVAEQSVSIESLYCWNYISIQNALKMKCPEYWLTPLTYGFFEQQVVELPLQMQSVIITVLCRRSRMMAGTRYQRRGLSSSARGEAANEVQTEVIITDGATWEPDSPYAAMALHRGSIPLFWGHDQEKVSQPKPDIIFTRNDPEYAATEIHFRRLLLAYSSPIVCLSLIRQGNHKECMIGAEYDCAIQALEVNARFDSNDIAYLKYDFLAEQKAGKNIAEEMKALIDPYLSKIGFLLHNKVRYSLDKPKTIQRGVFRVNCIDCLDRTNFAQFCIVQRSFALLLEGIGWKDADDWENTYPKIGNCLKELFIRHGDRIANQYAGSGAMHKHAFLVTQSEDLQDQEDQELEEDNKLIMDQVRGKVLSTFGKLKTNAANNNALTAIRRYYSNAITDKSKNQAIQVFLGHFKPSSLSPAIWELPTENVFNEELAWNPADEIPFIYPWADTNIAAVKDNPHFYMATVTEDLIDFSFINNNNLYPNLEKSKATHPDV